MSTSPSHRRADRFHRKRRVIEQTVRETLPDDFQTAEFQVEHGMIDPRRVARRSAGKIARLHTWDT